MTERYESIVVEIVSRLMVPLIQLFAIYVIIHGHYSPGGGFQGGVILASSIILLRLALGEEISYRSFPPRLSIALGTTGMLVFAAVGLIPMALGGSFLDYAHLPWSGLAEAELRYYGILIVESAVGLAVWGTLVTIYDCLAEVDDA